MVLVVDGADIGWPAYMVLRMYGAPCMQHPPHGKAIYIWLGATSMDDPWGIGAAGPVQALYGT